MLQRDRKMFKLIYKNYIKKFVVLCFLSVLLAGCSKSVKEETAQVVVKKENKPPEKEVQPEEKQKEKLSEMYNWDNARIPSDWYYPNFGEGQILQNQDYIFYPEDGNKIARISKSDGSKEIICEFDFIEDKFIHYCLSEDGMFVEYNSNIYSCGFDGENMHKIISRKKLKKQITSIKDDGWDRWYGGAKTLYFYKDNLYLVSYYYMWKLDLTTKKITQMSETTFGGGCFCGGSLYYIADGRSMVYRTDINTGKRTRILGTGERWSKENSKRFKTYSGLTEVDGKVYYVQIGKKTSVYMYREGKKDKKIYDFDKMPVIYSIRSDSGKIAIKYKYNTDKPYNIIIYDIKSSTASKIKNIKDCVGLVYFVDDMIFYGNQPLESTNEYLLYKVY